MDPSLTVYHGLDCVMFFQQFTTHFNQPISTTLSKKIGIEFSEGTGIVLTLKSGLKDSSDTSKTPKYLSVSWLSAFPAENEQLFYGDNVKFTIHDIIKIEGKKNKSYLKECNLLNKFEKMIQNNKIKWNGLKQQQECKRLEKLIITQQRMNITTDEKELDEIKEYGQELFDYFCNHINTKFVIRNYLTLPNTIRKVLFENENKFSLIPVVNLFGNLTTISLTDLSFDYIKQKNKHYIDAVLQTLHYIQNLRLKLGAKLTHIRIQSKNHNKEDSSLQITADNYRNRFSTFGWKIGYDFDLDNKHNLTFVRTETTDAANSINYRSKHKRMHLWDKKPLYFMQITSANGDNFHVVIIAHRMVNTDTELIIKEITNDKHFDSSIIIEANKQKTTLDINIGQSHNNEYNLAIYDPINTKHPLPNTNQINLISMSINDYHSDNNYKPKPIDVSTILKAKDDINQRIYIYWSTPQQLHGAITYKICTDEDEKINETELKLLPFSIPFASIPIKLRIITISTIDNRAYQSEPSELISIGYLCPPIKNWAKFPNLLQILIVDEDSMQIKFTLKRPTKKTKYRVNITNVDNDETRSHLLIIRNGTENITDIDAIPNAKYRIVLFCDEKEISNSVIVKSSTKGFNPNKEKYIPSPPSVKTVNQYYDETKENILVIWDYPNDVFGDEIIYQIQSSHQQKPVKIKELPYKMPAMFANSELKITTISIIDGIRYEGKESDSLYIGI
eukprot:19980_1